MEGEDGRSDDERSFSKISIPKRMAIVVAGALVNIIFAVVVYFMLMFSTNQLITNKVANVMEGYVSEEIGLEENDEIIQINGKKVDTYTEVSKEISKINEQEVTIDVKRGEEILTYSFYLTEVKTKNTGIYVGEDAKIVYLEKDGAAIDLLKENDTILKVNGYEILDNIGEVFLIIQESKTDNIVFEILRDDKILEVEVTAQIIPRYYIGIEFMEGEKTFVNGVIYASEQTNEFLFSIVDNLKMLFTGNVGVDQMTGAIGISTMVADTKGMTEYLYLVALISLSLGVTNLLPIPALDGGKILILCIEAIRKKPMSPEIETRIQLIGFMILMGLTLVVTYNDIIRIF